MKGRRASTTVEATPLRRLIELGRGADAGAVSEAEDRADKAKLLSALAERHAGRPRPRHRWLLAVAAMIALAIGFGVLRKSPTLRYEVVGGGVSEGYIQAPDGGLGATVRFSEGSELTFGAGTRGRIADVSPHGASVVLESGAVRVQVHHLPKAAWSVQAGPYRIAVIGTTFDVRWSGQVLEVELHTGAIVVRGPLAAGEISLQSGQRLVAQPGGELRVGSLAEVDSSPASRPDVNPARRGEPAVAPPPPPAAASAVTPAIEFKKRWSERVAAGDFASVLAGAEARGLEATLNEAPLLDLVALADAARYTGQTDLARRALLKQRLRFPGSATATAAAFLLGRMSEDALGQSAGAITYYDHYLSEAPSGAFAAEALGRRMIALKRTAGLEAALPSAKTYLARFPRGAYAAAAQEIVGSP